MNRYENYETSSRIAFGSAAVALTVLGLGLLLVLPATLTPASHESRSASSQAAAATNEANGRLRIEVIGVREPSVATTQAPNQTKRRQEG